MDVQKKEEPLFIKHLLTLIYSFEDNILDFLTLGVNVELTKMNFVCAVNLENLGLSWKEMSFIAAKSVLVSKFT